MLLNTTCRQTRFNYKVVIYLFWFCIMKIITALLFVNQIIVVVVVIPPAS